MEEYHKTVTLIMVTGLYGDIGDVLMRIHLLVTLRDTTQVGIDIIITST